MKMEENQLGVIIFAFVILGSFFFGFARQYYLEYRVWNNGICKKNGIKWDRTSSDGDVRTYKAGMERLFITFKSIDKKVL